MARSYAHQCAEGRAYAVRDKADLGSASDTFKQAVQSRDAAASDQMTMSRMSYAPPLRVWFHTGNGWASRAWEHGEKAAYIRDVLRQEV